MNDTVIILLGIATLIVIGLAFVAYMINTNHIIREQEREIARLQTALRRGNRPTIDDIPSFDEIKKEYPDFGGF